MLAGCASVQHNHTVPSVNVGKHTYATGENGFSTKGVNAGKKSVSDGSVVFDSASDNAESTTVDWPLAEGDYDVYFFCCFDNDVLAGPVEFTIDSGDGN